MFNRFVIAKVFATNLFLVSLFMMVCVPVAWIYNEIWQYLFWSALLTLAPAALIFYFTRSKLKVQVFSKRDAYLAVSSSWISLGLAGALPYLLSGYFSNPVDALFESISGFTTTGSSILTDIEALPKALLLWRSFTHWIGGIGIVLLVVVLLPSLKISGYHLFSSESTFHERIQPRISRVGLILVMIYLLLTFAQVFFLMLGGMNLFESLCHAFGTVATGGFSPKNDSIAGYSPYIQYVIMIFMLLAATNYLVFYLIITGKARKVLKNDEFWFYLKVTFFIGLSISLILFLETDLDLEEAFRDAMFQTISIITCTGFATDDYLQWPVYAWLLIFLAMFLGGSTGSTAGGIKIVRHLVFWRSLRAYFQRIMHPQGIVVVRLNDKTMDLSSQNNVANFIVTYILVFAAGTVVLILLGNDGLTSAGSAATCLAGIGPGLGTTGPVSNFAHLSDLSKLVLMLMMLLGRLELYTLLALMSRGFWKP